MTTKQNYTISTAYSGRWVTEDIPSHELPRAGMSAEVAYQIVMDELQLDGNPKLNLASFVTTWMEPNAEKIISEGMQRNFIDQDEYPQLKKIEDRLLTIEAKLLNIPDINNFFGVTTLGSSEAIMLALLAHKTNWKKNNPDINKKPNIIFSADVHTCWHKFCTFFEVEMRQIPMFEGKYTITVAELQTYIDENTIAVGAVIGTTFTGQMDDVITIDKTLKAYYQRTGHYIPIHVDAASGGFILPFIAPELTWDFRLEHVQSINISNHKYGLVYAGLGSLLFKSKDLVADELKFKINYLGGEMENYSLNFSRSSGMILAQYYMFLRLGFKGYQRIIKNIMHNAHYLEQTLLQLDYFELLTDTRYLPVIVVKQNTTTDSTIDLKQLSHNLRKYGWIIPAYTLPKNAEQITVLRIVVKENFTKDIANKLVSDIHIEIKTMLQQTSPIPEPKKTITTIC